MINDPIDGLRILDSVCSDSVWIVYTGHACPPPRTKVMADGDSLVHFFNSFDSKKLRGTPSPIAHIVCFDARRVNGRPTVSRGVLESRVRRPLVSVLALGHPVTGRSTFRKIFPSARRNSKEKEIPLASRIYIRFARARSSSIQRSRIAEATAGSPR